MFDFDDSELRALSADLGDVGRKALPRVTGVFREAAHELKETWRGNAKETSGTHARHYPLSITWEEKFGTNLTFEVGPDEGKLQGKLGDELEFGTATSPAHLDGQRAADEVVPLLGRRIALAAEDVFGDA